MKHFNRMPTIKSNLCIPLSALSKVGDDTKNMEIEMQPRSNTAFRPLCVKCGVFGANDGSGYAEFGNTRVLAQINGPNSDGKWEEDYAKITIDMKGVDAETNAKYRGQISSAINAVIFAHKYPGKVIDVEIVVLSDDGGILATSLVAASLAICHSGIENTGLMSSVHVGLKTNGEFITDPSNLEQKDLIGGINLSLVPNLDQITCVDIYGRIPFQQCASLVDFSKERAIGIVPTLHKAVLNNVKEENEKR